MSALPGGYNRQYIELKGKSFQETRFNFLENLLSWQIKSLTPGILPCKDPQPLHADEDSQRPKHQPNLEQNNRKLVVKLFYHGSIVNNSQCQIGHYLEEVFTAVSCVTNKWLYKVYKTSLKLSLIKSGTCRKFQKVVLLSRWKIKLVRWKNVV